MNIGNLARSGVNPIKMRSALIDAFEAVEVDETMGGFRFVCFAHDEPRLLIDYECAENGKWTYWVRSIRSWRGNEIALKKAGAMRCL